MNLQKWNLFLIVMLTLISIGIQLPSAKDAVQSDQRPRRHVSRQSFNPSPYWEHILREFVFKTISPPPPGNHHLYKRLLDAAFYGGPFPIASNDATSVVLSRGDVYYQPNDHWLLCQQGCIDCEVCTESTHPTMKWVLRRIKRVSTHGTTRHDLQLTIVPQVDGSYHMRSLWPRSYVYVTSQGEQDAYLSDKHSYRNDGGAYLDGEDDAAERKGNSGNFWTLAEKNSLNDRRVYENSSGDGVPSNEPKRNVTGEKTRIISGTNNTEAQVNDSKDAKKQLTGIKVAERDEKNGFLTDVKMKESGNNKVRTLGPKLILGTDQLGQKHLVHVIPADASTNANLINSLASNILNSSAVNKTAYQRILRRIFDSLNSNKKSIETFLEPLKHSGGKTNEENEEHVQQETRNGLAGLSQEGPIYPIYRVGNRNDSLSQKQWSHNFNWGRQRRDSGVNHFLDRLINNTIGVIRGSNNSFASGLKPRNGVTNFTTNSGIRNITFVNPINNNFIPSRQNYNISPGQNKIVISTESTTKSGEITDYNGNARNYSYPISTNQNGALNNSNSLYVNVRNMTL